MEGNEGKMGETGGNVKGYWRKELNTMSWETPRGDILKRRSEQLPAGQNKELISPESLP